jgi:DNA-binding MarR family transcriptional regulator/N-acetylglutamate synthase-like GNAT family acetyltransferase
MSDAIPLIRRFHRTVTQRVGALNSRYLGRDRPLAESRLLFEIGDDGAAVRELRARLGLDSGFVSRMLRALEGKGLVRTGRLAGDDGRVRFTRLTRLGKGELRRLNELSDELAQSILTPLSPEQRRNLLTAMADVERLLRASAVELDVEKPAGRDAVWCLEQYFQELDVRFRNGFDPKMSIPAAAEELTPPKGYLVVARLFGQPIGCGALKITGRELGQVKRMWVATRARGLGIGRRILGELERIAHTRRLKILRLETNESLKEAQSLYRTSGYVEVDAFNDEPYAHHWFEKRVR